MAALLTTLALLKAQLGIPSAVVTYDATLTRIADATNLEIENFCNRHFTLQEYVETLQGTDDRIIQLRNHPITRITYSATGSESIITVNYTGALLGTIDIPRTNQNTPITEMYLDNGTTLDTVTISSTETLVGLVALIDALPDWTATVSASYDPYPARALTPAFYGSLAANGSVCLNMALNSLQLLSVNSARGDYNAARTISEKNTYTIMYIGGYATPYPADLVQGATQLGADTYRNSSRDGELKSEKIGEYAWSRDIALYLTEQVTKKFQVFQKYKNIAGC